MAKTILLLATHHDDYSVNRIKDYTMTVGELLEILLQYEDDTPIALSNDGGYTYGKIGEDDITEEELDDDPEY